MDAGASYTYRMGHFPAPWGNEIRAGVLEGLTATVFGVVMLLSVAGGMDHTYEDVEGTKLNLFFIMIDMMLSSLRALIYTNDLFPAYVFVLALPLKADCIRSITGFRTPMAMPRPRPAPSCPVWYPRGIYSC